MDIWTYMNTVASSKKTDWLYTVCWGYGSSGCFHDDFFNESIDDQIVTNVDKHGNYASYAKNLSISLAWGLGTENKELKEPWTQVFSDKNARMYFLDFFYNSALVYRETVVTVDDGRCILPLPKQLLDENDQSKVIEYRTNPVLNNILRLVNSFFSRYDYDEYIKLSGIKIADSSYPIL